MAKMTDVAKLAGVSPSTVSRVLAGGDAVTADKKQKVLMAIEKLNYRPNKLARNLRKLETKTVVVVVPDISNPFFSEIIRGMEQVAQEKGYHVLLGNTQLNKQMEIEYIELVRDKLADGIILLVAQNPQEQIIEASSGLPIVVACAYLDGNDIPTVNIDHFSSAIDMVNHLVSLGHRRIAYISGPLKNNRLSSFRFEGYCQGLFQNQIEIEKQFIVEGNFTIECGYEKCRELLELPTRPTAIFAANDEMAIGAIKAIKELGLKVPEDIAVVGFDDIKLSAYIEPPLTTISQPKQQIGAEAMKVLLQCVDNEALSNYEIILDSKLIVRRSCGSHLHPVK